MKKFIIGFLLLFLVNACVGVSGIITTTTIAPGLLISNTTEHVPLYDSITLGSGKIIYREESCSYYSALISFFYKADLLNPYALAKDRGITKIGVIDYSSLNVLGIFFYRRCIIIWGEKE